MLPVRVLPTFEELRRRGDATLKKLAVTAEEFHRLVVQMQVREQEKSPARPRPNLHVFDADLSPLLSTGITPQ
jgi:hypothetical protein